MFKETRIAAKKVNTLNWGNDYLVDWASGGKRYYLNGSVKESGVYYAFGFDACCVSPSGVYTVLYKKLGTKGVILRNGVVQREINRSYYCAESYEYPVCLFTGPNGRELIAHCPEEYNRIEIHDLETGEILTQKDRNPSDFFHSRFSTSPSSRYLLSCGWVWHPIDIGLVFDLQEALLEPCSLDQSARVIDTEYELSTATFKNDQEIIASTNNDDKSFQLGVWNIENAAWTVLHDKTEPLGALMALEGHFVVSFYNHPKVFDLRSGELVQEWPDLKTGKQTSSIIHHIDNVPPLALDPQRSRFALACTEHITIIEFEIN